MLPSDPNLYKSCVHVLSHDLSMSTDACTLAELSRKGVQPSHQRSSAPTVCDVGAQSVVRLGYGFIIFSYSINIYKISYSLMRLVWKIIITPETSLCGSFGKKKLRRPRLSFVGPEKQNTSSTCNMGLIWVVYFGPCKGCLTGLTSFAAAALHAGRRRRTLTWNLEAKGGGGDGEERGARWRKWDPPTSGSHYKFCFI